jgi:hypothetical protein
VGPIAGLDTEARGKILCLAKNRTPVSQSVARHYTDASCIIIFYFRLSYLKLVLYSPCIYKCAHDVDGILKDSRGFCLLHCWSDTFGGHNRNQKHVIRIIANMSPGLMLFLVGTEDKRGLICSVMVWNDAKDDQSSFPLVDSCGFASGRFN